MERSVLGGLEWFIQLEVRRAGALDRTHCIEQRLGDFSSIGSPAQRRRQRRGWRREWYDLPRKRGDHGLVVIHEYRSVLQHGPLVAPLRAPHEFASIHDQLTRGGPLEARSRGRHRRAFSRDRHLDRDAEALKAVDE
jgi:hypothetical protein